MGFSAGAPRRPLPGYPDIFILGPTEDSWPEGKALEYILYHKNCEDGFGAAWVAWKALGDQAEYIPVQHSEMPPELPDRSRVTIIDFSYPRDVIIEPAVAGLPRLVQEPGIDVQLVHDYLRNWESALIIPR